jgi:hypothetical protein
LNDAPPNRAAQLAGWPLRSASLETFERYLDQRRPVVVEISKDMVDGEVSTKELRRCLERYRETNPDARVSFAGTTDFTGCAGFSFDAYLGYLAIQVAQARFLGATFFRLFVGEDTGAPEDCVLDRLARFDTLLDPILPLVELHLGWESSTGRPELLLERTPFAFVVDFENLMTSGLDPADLLGRLPESRVAYAHARNLPPDHVEHPSSLDVERAWCALQPATPVLWEPKRLSCAQALEVIDVD